MSPVAIDRPISVTPPIDVTTHVRQYPISFVRRVEHPLPLVNYHCQNPLYSSSLPKPPKQLRIERARAHIRLVFNTSLDCWNIDGYASVAGAAGGQVTLVVCNAFKSLISEWYYGMRLLLVPRAPRAAPPLAPHGTCYWD